MADAPAPPQADRFIPIYALAWAGGAVSYTPLLTILLPVRVADLAGTEAGVDWLAIIMFAGALAASLGGIVFGYLSDVTRSRRGWIAAGLVLSSLLLVRFGSAVSLAELVLLIVAWQLAVNMVLGPLAALAGDKVPDARKGMLGGFIAFAPAMGAMSGVVVTHPDLLVGDSRLVLVAVLVVACVLPVLLYRSPDCQDAVSRGNVTTEAAVGRAAAFTGDAMRMWLARLAIQLAEATMFAYLYIWLVDLDPGTTDNRSAGLFGLVMLISVPLALAIGRWSDRTARPMRPLCICALVSAGGLVGMALAADPVAAVAGYGLFGVASGVFLALHSAQTLRVLPRPDRRGRDLGLFNLANTLPSLIMPLLAVGLIPHVGFKGLFLLLAVLAGGGALLLAVMDREG